ncbi:DEAD/DEAH box helicase [Porticoccus sp.]|nr:DEAD/DEAH box helicase [Porticoccus sp.]
MSFADFGLSEQILKALKEKEYTRATPIQIRTIPLVSQGKDIIATAQTGTGKTASFLLPILQLLIEVGKTKPNQARSLVLAPTRELAIQIGEHARQYSKFTSLRINVVYGGVKINPQMMDLRKGADILVATPGRLLDLISKNAVKFTALKVLVLDEADRMLDLGFLDQIQKILSLLPNTRQNLMFSATFSKEILSLSKKFLNNPMEISISSKNTAADLVKHWVFPVDKKLKPELLSTLILYKKLNQVLVFTNTKKNTELLSSFLNKKGLNSSTLHGDKNQSIRAKHLFEFKKRTIRVLISTDIAARGIDVSGLQCVINFELPKIAENYIHRIGRTGRAGVYGKAISLVSADEFENLQKIETVLRKKIPREIFEGFEPQHNLPCSKTKSKPKKRRRKTSKTTKKGIGLTGGLNLQTRVPDISPPQ